MTEIKAIGKHTSTLSAKIIRADGTVEDLGMIASSRWSDRIKIKIKQLLRRFK